MEKIKEVLDMIIADCEKDVIDFDGREFNGKTLGELHGILEAKIQALAKIVRQIIDRIEKLESHYHEATGFDSNGNPIKYNLK